MQCFKCKRRRCYTKIICHTHHWEFAACYMHINDLEKKADSELGSGNGVMRDHITSTSPMRKELINHKQHKEK